MKKKIAHLQLRDSMSNKATLVGWLEDGSIRYSLYSSWTSSGTPLALSNMQWDLPVHVASGMPQHVWLSNLIADIDTHSVYTVGSVVEEVEFP